MALTDLEERRLPAQRGNEPFRSRRITSPSFAAGCYARFLLPQHLGGKLVQARVIDLSVRGIGALLPGSESEPRHAPPVGTILPELALQYFGTELFRGTAEVIHNRVQDAGVRLGLCLTSDFVDMHMLHRRVHRLAARERWQSLVVEVSERTERPFVARPPEGIAPDFAAWVEKQRRFFEAACALLKSLEREARQWDALTCSEIIDDVFTELKGDMARGVATLSEELNQHLAHLPQDLQTTYKKHVAVRVGPYFMDGRFYWRARNRPLGYRGDYEMMNILYGAETDGEGLLARLLDFTAREQPVGRAVINRREYLVDRIVECVRANRHRQVPRGKHRVRPRTRASTFARAPPGTWLTTRCRAAGPGATGARILRAYADAAVAHHGRAAALRRRARHAADAGRATPILHRGARPDLHGGVVLLSDRCRVCPASGSTLPRTGFRRPPDHWKHGRSKSDAPPHGRNAWTGSFIIDHRRICCALLPDSKLWGREWRSGQSLWGSISSCTCGAVEVACGVRTGLPPVRSPVRSPHGPRSSRSETASALQCVVHVMKRSVSQGESAVALMMPSTLQVVINPSTTPTW